MVATTTSSTVTATPTVDASNLAKGLFTDLGPLLALFGDEVTKQFLSVSFGFGDDLLLAIAPIGIITIIVSAIRVGGYHWMKSLIGRARDSPDDEERELLSSTSSSVREIWNGHRVIRQAGESQIVELVFQEGNFGGLLTPLAEELESVSRNWVVERCKEWRQSSFSRLLSRLFRGNRKEDDLGEVELITLLLKKKAPNLTVNIPNAITDPMHLWRCVFIGAILQCLVFFFNAYVVYHEKWLRAGARVAPYGFPLWASGTLSIIVGLFMCAFVIENVTTEYVVKKRDNAKDGSRIVRFQKPIPLMNLPAYAFLHKDSQVLVSQRTTLVGKRNISDLDEIPNDITTDLFLQKQNRTAFITLLGTAFALSGFVIQNLGTRELHFSASVAQLLATLALTVLRSWARRNVGIPPPDCKELKRGFEAAHMISEVCDIRRFTDYVRCSMPESEHDSQTQLHIETSARAFLSDESPYRRYAMDLLMTHMYLKMPDMLPGGDQFLFEKAAKTIASLNDLGFSQSTRKLIRYCGKTLDSYGSNTVGSENSEISEGCLELAFSLKQTDIPTTCERLAAVWSFSFYDYPHSTRGTRGFRTSIWAFHIVAVCKVADYGTKFQRLCRYIGDHNFIAWQMISGDEDKEKIFVHLAGLSQASRRGNGYPLFGLHYLKKCSFHGLMQLEVDDVIITYGNSHELYEHLAVDLISAYLLDGLFVGDPQVAASSTRHRSRWGRARLGNDYFERLSSKLEDCITDDDLRLAAIIPAYIHYGIMPPEPEE